MPPPGPPSDIAVTSGCLPKHDRRVDASPTSRESPLSEQCQEEAQSIERTFSTEKAATDESFVDFAEQCAPDYSPYAPLPAYCQGIVFTFFVQPEVEGVMNVGGTTNDDQQEMAARFVDNCMS